MNAVFLCHLSVLCCVSVLSVCADYLCHLCVLSVCAICVCCPSVPSVRAFFLNCMHISPVLHAQAVHLLSTLNLLTLLKQCTPWQLPVGLMKQEHV